MPLHEVHAVAPVLALPPGAGANEPAAHCVHEPVLLVEPLNWPPGHGPHLRFVSGAGAPVWRWPAVQFVNGRQLGWFA
jgi:hypothetical protein